MYSAWFFGQCLRDLGVSRLIETDTGPPTGSPSSPPSSSFSLIQPPESAASVHWLGAESVSDSSRCLLDIPECSHARSLFMRIP